MRRNKLWSILCLSAMIILIIDARHAVQGAIDGLELCLYTVVPALFPYCVLSMIFQSAVSAMRFKLLRPIERICRMPEGSGIIFLLGILGGYPTGAICTARARLNKQAAKNILIFCNNAGPSFIFGIVSMIFPSFSTLLTIWIIQIVSAIITGVVLTVKSDPSSYEPIETARPTNVIREAVGAMVNVCAMIVLFRVMITCLEYWISGILPKAVLTVLIGISELTNGITYLNRIDHDAIRFIVCCGILSFGGICVAMQTLSVSKNAKLGRYLAGKTFQSLISMLIAGLIVEKSYVILIALTFFAVLIINKSLTKKKAVAFSA